MADDEQMKLATQLARIDERTQLLVSLVTQLQSSIDQKLQQQKNEFEKALETHRAAVNADLDDKVSEDTFWPVKVLVYGQAGIMLLAIIGAILKVTLGV